MNLIILWYRLPYLRLPKTWLLAMKLTTFFLLAAILTVSANSLAQKVTLVVHDASLEKVLQSLRQQTGYDYVGDEQLLDKADKVTLNLKDVQLRYALSQIFNNQPLTYSLENKAIIFKQKDPSFIDKIKAILALIDVNGRVTDSNGEPLPGASVIIKNSNIATTTDVNGFFKLTHVQPNAIVIISFIGFEKRELPVSANLGAIKLNTSSSKLDEIQVVAYGATTQRLATGSIAKVSAKEIQLSPESDPILSLAGRVAGVSITQNSGVAGSNFSINIRGQNTISAGKLPLYIVDGVPFGGQAVEQTAGTFLPPPSIIGSDGFNPLNVLSPDMIESIEILKDANATALYGSRAANGVIVITTKKGKAGATKLDANVYSGVSSVARTLPMLDASQYISMRQKAFANDGIIPTATNAPDLVSFTPGWDTDYQKYLFSQGHFTNANVNLSGGNAETQFLFGSNFRYEEPIFAGNYADKIGHVKLSMQHASKDQRFKFNVSINYSSENNSIPTFNLYNLYNLPPNLPLYTSTGALAWYTGYSNPVSALINPVEQKNNDLLGNLSFSYSIIKDLTFKTDAGYHTTNVDNVEAVLRAAQNPASASSANGVVYRNLTNTKLYNLEPQLNYSKQIAKGLLQALVGATYQYNNSDQPLFYFGTFTSDALYKDIGSVTLISKSTAYNERKYFSLFSRLNYIWDNKYIVNGNFRRDESSAFAPGNRYGNFGSVGAAWVVSEEKFLKSNFSSLSFFKLRSSYGSVGNDQIPAYGYLSYYSSSSTYSNLSTLNPTRLANNDNFSWEVTKKLDIAADLGFFKDRILLSATWYRDLTSNMLLSSVPLASQAGFTGYTGNVPGIKVENKGEEFELNTTNLQSKTFTWKTSFNFSINRNKVVSFPGLASSAFATGGLYRTGTTQAFVIGQPINLLYGYVFTGFNNGVATVKDIDGDGKITPGLAANGKGDYVALGTSDPKFYGGFNNSFTYKRFQLDVLFQFVKKQNFNIYHGSTTPPGSNANQPADVLNQPFTYSASASSPIYTSFVNDYALSDQTISDASYIRLKNLSLSYSLPTEMISHVHMNNASVFFHAQNLFTITKYKGFDPETFGSTFPLYRMITFGLQTSF